MSTDSMPKPFAAGRRANASLHLRYRQPVQSPARDRTGFEHAPSNPANGPQRLASKRMEFLMSIKARIAATALATLAVTGTIASTTQSAEAKGFGWGWGVGGLRGGSDGAG